jgi:SAM-dependent methyltransferase
LFEQRFSELSGSKFMTGYDVAICDACGLGYADGIPSQALFDAHYRDMSIYEHQDRGGVELSSDLSRLQSMAEFVQREVPDRDVRVLDIGCSTGGFLAMLKDAGYKNLLGIDPSRVCAETATRMYGIDAIAASIDSFEFTPGSYGLVVLSAVLEHVRDLRPVLSRVREMLGENGYLFVSVPDAGRFARYEGAPFQEFSTEHINFFSDASLSNLLRVAGFEKIQVSEDVCAAGDSVAAVAPVIDAMFKKSSTSNGAIVPDEVTRKELTAYIRRSTAVDDRIRQVLDHIAGRGQPILVWGTGTHTRRLLATSRLAEIPIAAFVDSNPCFHGQKLHGVPIVSPQDIVGRSEGILVSSRNFQQEICQRIRDSLRMANELFTLYN